MPGPIVKQASQKPLAGILQTGSRPAVSKRSVALASLASRGQARGQAPAKESVIKKIASFLGMRPTAPRQTVQGRDRFNRLPGREVTSPARLSSLVNGRPSSLRPDDQLLTHFLSDVIRNAT